MTFWIFWLGYSGSLLGNSDRASVEKTIGIVEGIRRPLITPFAYLFGLFGRFLGRFFDRSQIFNDTRRNGLT